MVPSKMKFVVGPVLFVLLQSPVFAQTVVQSPSGATSSVPGNSSSGSGIANAGPGVTNPAPGAMSPSPAVTNPSPGAMSYNPSFLGFNPGAEDFNPSTTSSNQGFTVLPSSFMANPPLSLGLPIRPLKLLFNISQGYDSNVYSANQNIVSGWFTSFMGHAVYNFGSPRLQLTTGADGGITYYPTIPSQRVQPSGDYYLNATYKATPRLTLSTTNMLAYYSQPQVNVQGISPNANNFFTLADSVSALYQWSQIFSTVTSYSLNAVYYSGVSGADQAGYASQLISQSANWLVLPKTTFVVQYMANPITYFSLSQNSFSNFALVGVNQLLTSRASEQLRLGAEVTSYQNNGNGTQTTINPYMQSTFNFQLGPTSTLSWNMTYGTQPSGLATVAMRQSFTSAIYWTQAVTARITTTVGFNYQNNYYSNSDAVSSGSQNVFGLNLGVNFALNRFVSLSTGYNFYNTTGDSDLGVNYVRSQIFCGANLSF